MEKSNAKIKAMLKKIILLTASIDDRDNSVWGHDTDLGKIDDILDEAYKIIKPALKEG